MRRPILISACLLGLSTRYNGVSKNNDEVLQFLKDNHIIPIPVCPEQLAGLPTPRPPACFSKGDGAAVLDGDGELLNEQGLRLNETFLKGALEALRIARISGCRHALLKERSPSCGVHQVIRQGNRVPGSGVTCALLRRNRIDVFSEKDLAEGHLKELCKPREESRDA